jgi:hypothetical protein
VYAPSINELTAFGMPGASQVDIIEYIDKLDFIYFSFHIWEINDYAVTFYKYQVVVIFG